MSGVGGKPLTESEKRMLANCADDGNFRIWYDDDAEKRNMFVKVPLQTVVADESFGTIIARGFFDQLKSETLSWINFFRNQKRANRIIAPGGAALNGDVGASPTGLKVLK